MDHFQELTTRGEFICFVFRFFVVGDVFLGVPGLEFGDCGGSGDVAVRSFQVVGVDASVLSV
jgi:hypothetical protein